jgi:hypothetical protein
MGWVIVIVVIGVVLFIAYRRYLPFRQFVKNLQNLLGGSASVSPKRLGELDNLLKAEQEKTKKLEEQAKLAESARAKEKAISDERRKQQAARNKITGKG